MDLLSFSMNGRRFYRNERIYSGNFVDYIGCCVGVGDRICFIVFEERKVKEILAYSLTENTWSWSPSRTLNTTASIGDCCEIPMAFEPRPDMKVD